MQQIEEKIIPYDSPEAASFKTVTGWVSSNGIFCGNDEHVARYRGCTHVRCKECNAITPKQYTYCDSCREAKDIKRWESFHRKDWNGEDVLYSEACDIYFFDIGELSEYCSDNEMDIESLRLVICEPILLRQIDSSYWCDELAEDQELPWEVEEAMNRLNEAIRAQPAVSWMSGKYVPTGQSIKINED